MGNSQTIPYVNFEDMQTMIKNPNNYFIINTLPTNEQSCLILNTISANDEVIIINKCLKSNILINIVIYGKNCNDFTIKIKYEHLLKLGFTNVFIYNGGLFEWLLLQDIYGFKLFPTNIIEHDILKYKSPATHIIPYTQRITNC